MQKIIKELTRDVLAIADRRGYGIGECGYYFETMAWDAIVDAMSDEEYERVGEYDIDAGDGINLAERNRLKAEQPELYKRWRELVRESETLARTLSDAGITRIE